MLEGVRRSVATLCLTVLALQAAGCTRTISRERTRVIPPGTTGTLAHHITGVTLRNGREVRFDARTPPFVNSDTLHAMVGREEFRAPLSDVQRVWVQSGDGPRTTYAVVGVAAATFVAGILFSGGLKPQRP